MKKEDKNLIIEDLKGDFSSYVNFYVADTTTMTVEQINQFRRLCFKSNVKVKMAKNKLIQKAMQAQNMNIEALGNALKGQSVLLFSENANEPAKLISAFRKDKDYPYLKAAYIDSDVFLGDDQLSALVKLKSKAELVGEIIGILQSPAKNVISALQSSSQKLAGIVKTLSEKPE